LVLCRWAGGRKEKKEMKKKDEKRSEKKGK
jgi:hypothetical protein